MCTTTTAAIHPFEKAGLGKAPFRYVGMVDRDVRPDGSVLVGTIEGVEVTTDHAGGTCDYCGMAIVDMYRIRSADGRHSRVGSDCVEKCCGPKLVAAVVADDRKAKRARKQAREDARIAAAIIALPTADLLDSQPHPTTWRAQAGETMRGWCGWMFANAGRTGKLEAARVVERAIAPRVDD